jgi:hypothetical protein
MLGPIATNFWCGGVARRQPAPPQRAVVSCWGVVCPAGYIDGVPREGPWHGGPRIGGSAPLVDIADLWSRLWREPRTRYGSSPVRTGSRDASLPVFGEGVVGCPCWYGVRRTNLVRVRALK